VKAVCAPNHRKYGLATWLALAAVALVVFAVLVCRSGLLMRVLPSLGQTSRDRFPDSAGSSRELFQPIPDLDHP
jgi:hypothetical protein